MDAARRGNRASIIGESFRAMADSARSLFPYLLGLSLFSAALSYYQSGLLVDQPTISSIMDNQRTLVKDPNLAKQALAELRVIGWPLLCSAFVLYFGYFVAHYVLTAKFLSTISAKAPACSTSGFFSWAKVMVWKYVRPILWLLIPIIGIFFYIRSLVRYALVSPLAIFRSSPELEKSWDLTQGNWWRVFLAQAGVAIVICLAVSVIAFTLTLVALFLTHGDAHSLLYMTLNSAIYGITESLVIWGDAVFSCVACRILLQEQRQNAPVNPS